MRSPAPGRLYLRTLKCCFADREKLDENLVLISYMDRVLVMTVIFTALGFLNGTMQAGAAA